MARQWVNEESTVCVTRYDDGTLVVLLRPSAEDVWGAPIKVTERPT